jgi:hypothetical protein
MKYTLLTSKGSIMCFYVESVATLYQRLYGGVVFSSQVLDTVAQPDTMATY